MIAATFTNTPALIKLMSQLMRGSHGSIVQVITTSQKQTNQSYRASFGYLYFIFIFERSNLIF